MPPPPSLNPEFKKKFETDYMFEEVQCFRFQVRFKPQTLNPKPLTLEPPALNT